MPTCAPRGCGCAFTSSTLVFSPDPENPGVINIEQAEFTDITTLQADVLTLQSDVAALQAKFPISTADIGVGQVSASRMKLEACRVWTSTASVVHGVINNVSFPNEDFDPLGWHSTTTNPERITPNIAGWYQVIGYAGLPTDPDNDYNRFRLSIRFNAGENIIDERPYTPAAGIGPSAPVVAGWIYCNGTTDYIALGVFQSNTDADTANNVFARLNVQLMYA